MPLLYYWRGDNYRRDLDFGVGYHLNQANPALHQIDVGDSLWAFTRRKDGVYVIAAELIVHAKTLNPFGFRYGRYRLWGDLSRSKYFSVEGQPDITVLIRGLSVSAKGKVLGGAFQGNSAVRKITPEDHRILSIYAGELPLEPRARLIPEERLEALIVSGDETAVAALLRDEPSGLAEERRQYLMLKAPTRNRGLVEKLRDLYDGQCQLCRWNPRGQYKADLCQAHHMHWLSQGGMDLLGNMVLLCPNHHWAVHRCFAPFDWGAMGFKFEENTERLEVINHELVA